ncbi:radical SAM superfamily protein [Bordetella holmesii 30539]|uniref:Heme chaperone HemW n=1 Tax=Bordetella holmesii 1058 TaxID=1247648 RepID=A0ABN0RZ35_9BORD|nr:radical SAM superfamily protein [Bordetella holmesii ATCC 51541]AIT28267.1 radical SAM superfamily protein [Bordetella holmesii 44057]EWM41056.1 radical SAM superfamily protein [Bordetella holmesii 35009]EWM44945.1 radical SAM superfamily protein [Bordetella holmesii 70147]EXF88271.1 radical SAM superfamily protein [Bordetella holmesii 30539]EXX94273.1 radical SAM superfamily protein [Bordetella holmesii 1058]
MLPAGSALTSLPPLSVYVHVPWCVRKCPYCDFNSHAVPGKDIPERAYLDALRADLEQSLPLIWGRQVISVFIGGGTPSLLSSAGLDELLAMLRACLNLWPDAEITMEANPGTAEAGRFMDYGASGVNRLSLGIQSFDDTQLRKLGRIHDANQARAAIDMAQRAVPRVNLDLMFALPGQDLDACLDDVRQALGFGTEHLSMYHLTLEPNTVFAKYPPEVPDDDLSALMQDAVKATLGEAGLARYEVSAYARAGGRSKHNVNYWEFGDYLGLGPGAHGKLSFHDRIIRQARHRNPESWMAKAMAQDGSHIAESRQVGQQELPFEFMLNALRLKDGVAASTFSERTGLSLAGIAHQLEAATQRGLLDADPTRLRATALGWRFLNDLQEIFL